MNYALTRNDQSVLAGGEILHCHPVFSAKSVSAQLEASVGHVFSSAEFIFASNTGDRRIMALRNSAIGHPLLLFLIDKSRVRLFSDYMAFSAADIIRVSSDLFKLFGHARSVEFPAIELHERLTLSMAQRHNVSEDIIAQLPGSVAEYTAQLGRQLQTDLRRYRKKLCSEMPQVAFSDLTGSEISRAIFDRIISLSSARMTAKQIASSHSIQKSNALFELVNKFGRASVISSNGTVIAGALCTYFGGEIFMHVISHDPVHDKYRLGKLVCYNSICSSIAINAKNYHMLSGAYDYKFRFLGKRHDFDRVVVYRNGRALVRSPGLFVPVLFRSFGRNIKRYIRRKTESSAWAPRLLRRFALPSRRV